MKISSATVKALNNQIAMEADASNYYLSMASWCEQTGYEGAAKFFYGYSEEERQHMLKIVRFINGVGVTAVIPQAKQPPKTFKSLESVIKTALKNEQAVTVSIHKLSELVRKQKDYSTSSLLEWFVNEQVEEEQLFEGILQKFSLIGHDKLAVYEIDKILGNMTSES